MFTHYLKIAFRNLKKYKTQSAISIAGLSVGFVCFTLSMVWIRYEMTYDSFHRDADRIFRVRTKDTERANGLSSVTSYALAEYLKSNFPEIQSACSVNGGDWETEITAEGKKVKLYTMMADSAFLEMFSIPMLSGDPSVFEPQNDQSCKRVAITAEAARKLFGNENPAGKEFKQYENRYSAEAVLGSWNRHSNLCFDIIEPINPYKDLNIATCKTYIKLHKGINTKEFVRKMNEYVIEHEHITFKGLVCTPITSEHYDKPDKENLVKFGHIFLFAVCSALVILCSLFNFLTLFVSRIQMRSKELALRKVNGASNRSLLGLLGTELIVTLCCTLPPGIILIESILPQFLKLSGMQNRIGGLYSEIFLYAGIIICISYLTALFPIRYFNNKTLHNSIQGGYTGHNRNLFRKGNILLQLIVSMGFIFCTVVLIKQIRHFNKMDIGMERKNIATLFFSHTADYSVVSQEIRQSPLVSEVLEIKTGLFPQMGQTMQRITQWDEMQPGTDPVKLEVVGGSREFVRFYNLRFVQGEIPGENDNINKCVVINEAAWKQFGWQNPIGKKYSGDQTVVGVFRDYYNQSPTLPSHPVAVELDPSNTHKWVILFKYKEGEKESSRKLIQKIFDEKFPGIFFEVYDMETEYAKFMQSENYLLLLLGFASLVCVLVSLFGIYSLSNLTAEEKRKEIAVRKVNGASIREILLQFFREYLILLIVASVIAFPTGYVIMKPWIENYVKQTDINIWLYPAIFLLAGIVIICSVFSCIWKTAKMNPAEVIKSE